MKVELRDQIIPCWIEKYRPESHCDGRETSARLDSMEMSPILYHLTDRFSSFATLSLEPLQAALRDGYILNPSPVYNKLLTGSYIRYDELNTLEKVKHAENPHFIDKVEQAIVLRTRSLSDGAIEKKARDFKRKLVEANSQLPNDRPGVIHIGLEALGDDSIEHRRYEKIMAMINDFDPKGKPLSFIYWHYFAPEASPDETWAFDETFQWRGIGTETLPLSLTSLVLPPQAEVRDGMHWDGIRNKSFRQS